jgi:hypothetical protein
MHLLHMEEEIRQTDLYERRRLKQLNKENRQLKKLATFFDRKAGASIINGDMEATARKVLIYTAKDHAGE